MVGRCLGKVFRLWDFAGLGFSITKPDLYTWAGCLGNREDEQVDKTSHSPPYCLSRSGSLTTMWSRARAGASLSLSLRRTLEGLAELLGTLRGVTSGMSWPWLCLIPPWWPREVTQVSWAGGWPWVPGQGGQQLEGTLHDEVQGGETRLDERGGGGGGWRGGGKVKDIPLNKFIWMRKTLMMIIVMFQRSHYLRRGRDSLDEEGGRLGPRDSAGLEKVILIILKWYEDKSETQHWIYFIWLDKQVTAQLDRTEFS